MSTQTLHRTRAELATALPSLCLAWEARPPVEGNTRSLSSGKPRLLSSNSLMAGRQ